MPWRLNAVIFQVSRDLVDKSAWDRLLMLLLNIHR